MSLQGPTDLAQVEAYGIGSRAGANPTVVARVGDAVIDLEQLRTMGLLSVRAPDALLGGNRASVFRASSLNRFMALGSSGWRDVDEQLSDVLRTGVPAEAMSSADQVRLQLPVEVADFCDFYASENHAANMGKILRPGTDPLPAAWRTIPLGYHGRAGTVVVSGTPIRRPVGVLSGAVGAVSPTYGPSRRLDVEVELGYVIGSGSAQGVPVPVDKALDHVFGVVVLNDWSARDIQAFEYQPLGPFLGKSFATSISPWVVPMRALNASRREGPAQGEEVSPHLTQAQPRAFDITLELSLNSNVVSRTNARYVNWSVEQFVAHVTSNGASLRTGDILATGTISGPDEKSWGSLMELAWGAERPIVLNDGQKRSWLEDGDTATIRAWIDRTPAASVPLGEVTGTIIPANPANPANPASPANPANPASPASPANS